MGYNSKPVDEFEALAANVPKPQGVSIYSLVAMFSTRDCAETAMIEWVDSANGMVIIYCYQARHPTE